MALQRMDNVGIVVESLDAAISFFAELGLELEGRAMIEGDWSGRVTGLRDQRVEMAMMRMPDGHGKIELSRFLTPPPVADHRHAPVNSLGYLRVMFAVDDLDDTLARLRKHGAELVHEVVQYEDMYRLCCQLRDTGTTMGLALLTFVSDNLCRVLEAIRSGAPYDPAMIECHIDALTLARKEPYRNMSPDHFPDMTSGLKRVLERATRQVTQDQK